MKIGEGNSAISYLSREADGEYVVIKIYKPAHLVSLKRDHEGLQAVQDFFIMDKQHSPQLQVVASQIVKLDNGTFALKMPFVPGVNLHKFLVETAETNPLRQVAVDLYNQMISELHRDAQRLGLVDEVRVETDKYFQDHKIDGLMMLRINGNPSILIKSDNVIFNPAENSLTLIDPY